MISEILPSRQLFHHYVICSESSKASCKPCFALLWFKVNRHFRLLSTISTIIASCDLLDPAWAYWPYSRGSLTWKRELLPKDSKISADIRGFVGYPNDSCACRAAPLYLAAVNFGPHHCIIRLLLFPTPWGRFWLPHIIPSVKVQWLETEVL